MPVTRNGTSSTAPTSEEDGEWRSTDGGEGGASRGVPDSASASGTTTTPGPAFDMAAVLQATVQAAVREAINGIAHLQSQQTAAMACNRHGRDIAPDPFVRPNFVGLANRRRVDSTCGRPSGSLPLDRQSNILPRAGKVAWTGEDVVRLPPVC
ncbi:hypothetical protein MTO96_006036 [Rhipicephalus appendiculatus]